MKTKLLPIRQVFAALDKAIADVHATRDDNLRGEYRPHTRRRWRAACKLNPALAASYWEWVEAEVDKEWEAAGGSGKALVESKPGNAVAVG